MLTTVAQKGKSQPVILQSEKPTDLHPKKIDDQVRICV